MAKTDWESAARLFSIESDKTGISAKEWCEQNGYNYQSARRYLKTRAQSVTTSKTSRTAAQSSTKKPKKNAQTAQKSLRKSNAQNNSAQINECASAQIEPEFDDDVEFGESSKPEYKGRDDKGRFVKGEYEGNPNPSYSFPEGHQINRTHGGYAKYFDEPEVFDEVDELSIIDEIRFVRARIIVCTKSLNEIRRDLERVETLSERVSLYESLVRAEQALDRNIARVESLTRTLSGLQLDKSKLRLDDVMEPKIVADTEKSRSQKRKLDAETAKIERDQGGDTTPLDEIVGDLHEMGTGGLMS
jgi:hypothetical protein